MLAVALELLHVLAEYAFEHCWSDYWVIHVPHFIE